MPAPWRGGRLPKVCSRPRVGGAGRPRSACPALSHPQAGRVGGRRLGRPRLPPRSRSWPAVRSVVVAGVMPRWSSLSCFRGSWPSQPTRLGRARSPPATGGTRCSASSSLLGLNFSGAAFADLFLVFGVLGPGGRARRAGIPRCPRCSPASSSPARPEPSFMAALPWSLLAGAGRAASSSTGIGPARESVDRTAADRHRGRRALPGADQQRGRRLWTRRRGCSG